MIESFEKDEACFNALPGPLSRWGIDINVSR